MWLHLGDSLLAYSCLLLLVLWIYLRRIFRKNHRHDVFAKTLPGPRALPLIGNSLDFWYGGTAGVRKVTDYCKKYGRLYRLWFGRHLFIVMFDPHELETVFYKNATQDKPEIFLTPFRYFQGNGLSTCPMKIWRKTRRIVQPLYGKKELKFHIPEINRIIRNFVENMSGLAECPEFDICGKLLHITFNIIMKTNFDMEFTSNEISNLKIGLCNKVLAETGFLTMFRSWLHIPFIWNLRYYDAKNVKQDIREFTNIVLEGKLPQLKLEQQTCTDTSKPGWVSSMPFLSTLYKFQDETLNEDWLHDQIAFLIIAGVDGVAIMMSFFLLSLSMNPTVQLPAFSYMIKNNARSLWLRQVPSFYSCAIVLTLGSLIAVGALKSHNEMNKLHDELDAVFGDDVRQATYDDVERLVYLDQVLKETERLYTFLPFIFRNVDEDCKIGEHDIPAGTAILININHIHHNEKFYPKPYKFNPENFSPEAISQRPALSFLPFSHGPRNCIAVHYAALIMKLTLIALLRKFEFHTTMTEGDIQINVGFITTCTNGYNVSVKLRAEKSS